MNRKSSSVTGPAMVRVVWLALLAVVMCSLLRPLRLAAQGVTHTVRIYNFDFSLYPAGEPVAAPMIQPGDTVRWVWDQGFHSTTAALGQLEFWDSPVQSGGTFEHQFTYAGVFHYYSRPFGFDYGNGTAGGMSGAVFVIPEPGMFPLFAGSLLVLGVWRRAKRAKQQ